MAESSNDSSQSSSDNWGSILSFAGGLGGAMSSARSVQKQIDFQNTSMHWQAAWNKQMSSTAHQREVADLRAAGLNPILSGTGGMGSASPSSSGMSGASMQFPTNIGSEAVASALAIKRNAQEIKNMKAAEQLTKQEFESERHRTNDAWNASLISDFEQRVQQARRWTPGESGVHIEAERRNAESAQARLAARIERRIDQGSGSTAREVQRWIPSLNIGSGLLRDGMRRR